MEVQCSLHLSLTVVCTVVCTVIYLFKTNLPLLAVDLSAISNVWIIGDEFLRMIYHTFMLMQRSACLNNLGRNPYLFEHYNVSRHVMGNSNGIRNPAARIQNTIVQQLNSCKTMPRFIVIIPDNDILKHSSVEMFDFGTRVMIEGIVAWMVNEIEHVVLTHREKMKKVRKGSVMAGEPKLIYVKMMYRPK